MCLVQHYPALSRPEGPACSICVANYNGFDLLGDCLDSIFSQCCDFSFEVIVHDDASSDASVDFLRQRYPQVDVLASSKNVGFCIGNNRMAAHAHGEYLLLFNNDAALLPDALATLMADARKQSPQGILTLPQFDWQSGALVDRGCLLDPFYNPVPNRDPRRRDVAMVIGACMFMPRALWNELGGFPEWIESIGEDMYLCCAARLRGLPVQTTSGSGYRHRQGASFGGNRVDAGRLNTTYRRRHLSERNKTAVMVICTPSMIAWPLLAVHLMLLGIEGITMTIWRRDARIWKEIYWSAITLPVCEFGVLRSVRSRLQTMRHTGLWAYLKPVVFVPQKILLLFRHGVPSIR